MSGTRDRRELVRASGRYNGIDFIEIADDAQRTLVVHFLNTRQIDAIDPATGLPEKRDPNKVVRITGGESIPSVPVTEVGSFDPATRTLVVRVASPGDFSLYTLAIDAPHIDPYLCRARFSFKARCQSTWGIEPTAPGAGEALPELPPIDYLAKDYQSFQKALSDFSAIRYPAWRERSEADFGVMFMEALAALADDLSYYQDRVAAEAYLDTATERRSIVRHARLVDYEPRPATAARALLRLQVSADDAVAPGLAVTAQGPEGTVIDFETGTGLFDAGAYPVHVCWNAILPYYWDEEERTLPAGATAVWVADDAAGSLSHGASLLGRQVLLEAVSGEDPLAPPRRALVRITGVETGKDDLDATNTRYLTRLAWGEEDALGEGFDLDRTTLHANLVPATQGRTITERFAIEDDQPQGWSSRRVPLALARLGPAVPVAEEGSPGERFVWGDGAAPQYLHPLRNGPLAWLAPAADPAGVPRPEIRVDSEKEAWTFRRWLLDADPGEPAFTVDPVAYRALAPPRPDGSVFADLDGRGDTVRFGDGRSGLIPEPGTVFTVTYRVGGGARGNVAAGAVSGLDPASPIAGLVTSVTNPFAAEGGADEESDESVRRLAPEAFRADQRRAVLPADYEAQARRLPWVQRAGTTFRWTGSWPTALTTVDPRGAQEISPPRLRELAGALDRARLAGYESYVLEPRFVSLDLSIQVQASEGAVRSEVQAAILDALSSGRRRDGSLGFFHPDRFTFGQPLERSALEATIQGVPGLLGVLSIEYRERGRTRTWLALPDAVFVGHDQILRVDNDPNRPERGTLQVEVIGGQ